MLHGNDFVHAKEQVHVSRMSGLSLEVLLPSRATLVFISWFERGEVFRSGLCYHRGKGKIFYFRPGHETYPIFYQGEVLKVISNAVCWAAPANGPKITFGNVQPLEKIGK